MTRRKLPICENCGRDVEGDYHFMPDHDLWVCQDCWDGITADDEAEAEDEDDEENS